MVNVEKGKTDDRKGIPEFLGEWKVGYPSDASRYFSEMAARYCLIGGLAVNAYVEPVVSLDVDIVLATHDVTGVVKAAKDGEWKVEHSNTACIGRQDRRRVILGSSLL